MPEWTARGHHDRHRRRRDPDPNEWLARFGIEAPTAAAPRVVHHDWRQNFAPADFLPITYNLEVPWVRDHMNMMEQRGRPTPAVAVAVQQAPAPAPAPPAPLPANPIQLYIYDQPPPAAAARTLTIEEFLRLYHQPVPAQPTSIQVVRRLQYTSASASNPVLALPYYNLPNTGVSRRMNYPFPQNNIRCIAVPPPVYQPQIQYYQGVPTAPAPQHINIVAAAAAAPAPAPAPAPQYIQVVAAAPAPAPAPAVAAAPAAPQQVQLVEEFNIDNQTFWCKEKSDGAFTERTYADIMANCHPGHWERGQLSPFWVEE